MPPERDPQSEIEKLERRYAEHPEGRMFAHLADAYRKAGELEQAERLILEGLERHPEYLSAHIVLGRVFLDEGRYAEAQARFKVVLEMDPENLIALKALGDMALAEGSADAARGWYERMLQVDPYNEEAQTALGSIEPGPGGAPGAQAVGPTEGPSGGEAIAGGDAVAAAGDEEQAPSIDREVSGLQAQSSGGPASAADDTASAEGDVAEPPEGEVTEPGVSPEARAEAGDPGADAASSGADSSGAEAPPDPDAVLENLEAIMDEAAESAVREEAEADPARPPEPEAEAASEPDMPSGYRSPDPDRWDDVVPEAEDAPEDLPWERTLDFSDEEPAGEADAHPASDDSEGAGESPEAHAGAEREATSEPEPVAGELEGEEVSAGDLDLDMERMDEWSPGLLEDEYESTESFDTDELLGGARDAEGEEGLMTETMADLYARQGLLQEALKIYRELAEVRPHDEQLRAKIRDLEAEIGEPADADALDPELVDERSVDAVEPAGGAVDDLASTLDEADGATERAEPGEGPEAEVTRDAGSKAAEDFGSEVGEDFGPEVGEGFGQEVGEDFEPEAADRPEPEATADPELERTEGSAGSSWLDAVSPGGEPSAPHQAGGDAEAGTEAGTAGFEFERVAPPSDELAARDPFAASFEAAGPEAPADPTAGHDAGAEPEAREDAAREEVDLEPAGFRFGPDDEPGGSDHEPGETGSAVEAGSELEPEPEAEPEPIVGAAAEEPVGVEAGTDESAADAGLFADAGSGESIRDYLRALVGYSTGDGPATESASGGARATASPPEAPSSEDVSGAAGSRAPAPSAGSQNAEDTEGKEGSGASDPDPDDGSEDLEQFQEWLKSLKR